MLQHKMPEEDVNTPVRKTSEQKGDKPEDFLYLVEKKIAHGPFMITSFKK